MALHASDSSNRVDSARPSGAASPPPGGPAADETRHTLSTWSWPTDKAPPPPDGHTYEDLKADFELLQEWLENWFGLQGFEESTAMGMWGAEAHPRAIWNKINADRRKAAAA